MYSTHAQQTGLAATFPDYSFGSPNTLQAAKQRSSRNIDLVNQPKIGSILSSSNKSADLPQTSSASQHVASKSSQEEKINVSIRAEE